jgi:hypothetical protein
MEADRPMQHDERPPREADEMEASSTPPEEPSAGDDEDEFETTPWPARDIDPSPDATQPPPAELPPSEIEAHAPSPQEAATVMPAHTVPATEPGESTQCPRCGTENRPGIAFCRNCGQRLVAAGVASTVERPTAPEGTEACPRCGTHNRAGVPFCQNCGANMRAASAAEAAVTPTSPAVARGGALLGPIVLLVGAVGIAIAWLLPFPYGAAGSLWDRAFGAPDGYGLAFWSGYQQIGDLSAQTYFGFAAPAPLFVLLLAGLAVAGFLRARPGLLQLVGLAIALAWSAGLVVLFLVEELLGGPGGDLVAVLGALTPGGIIFMLASLIVVIGALTRFARS